MLRILLTTCLLLSVALAGCTSATPTHVRVEFAGCWTGTVNGEDVSGCGNQDFVLNGEKQTVSFTMRERGASELCAAWVADNETFGRACASPTVYLEFDPLDYDLADETA